MEASTYKVSIELVHSLCDLNFIRTVAQPLGRQREGQDMRNVCATVRFGDEGVDFIRQGLDS